MGNSKRKEKRNEPSTSRSAEPKLSSRELAINYNLNSAVENWIGGNMKEAEYKMTLAYEYYHMSDAKFNEIRNKES
jgi:hypothetical protein